MARPIAENDRYSSELRLLLEELCCDLCLFERHTGNFCPHRVRIEREFYLGQPGAFADILVHHGEEAPYCVEVKYGYSIEKLQNHLRRKYGCRPAGVRDLSKVVLVLDAADDGAAEVIKASLAGCLHESLAIEVWHLQQLRSMVRDSFGVEVTSITESDLLDAREAIERAKGFYAFGGSSLAEYQNDPLRAELLWHFDFLRLRQLRESLSMGPAQVLPPGTYHDVAVVVCDLCSFSSYVRDTPEDELTRHCLTSFYSKGRYAIITKGGMLYQIIGDSVVGLFGIPDQHPLYLQNAIRAARSLISICASVSHHWQRNIDHLQPASGCRIGIAIGDVQIVSCRPFGRTNIGVIGDPINLSARLQAVAQPDEIVVSNSFHNQLDESSQAAFSRMEPVEARNLGRIKAWKSSSNVVADSSEGGKS